MVPPGTGIVHQVNIEYLASVVMTRNGLAYPDTCVGTDSHTTMVNGLGVLGWGVGGIEAEAAMLGQPVSMLIPRVVGFKLTGEIKPGVTATDVVLTVTEKLRKHGVVGKFVEFYGEGVAEVPLANRATLGNMSPEFGSTAAIFPIDQETIDYLKFTGRKPTSRLPWSRPTPKSRACGTTRSTSRSSPNTSSSTCPRWCRRSPARSGRRTESCCRTPSPRSVRQIPDYVGDDSGQEGLLQARRGRSTRRSRPATRVSRPTATPTTTPPRCMSAAKHANGRVTNPVRVKSDERGEFVLDHGAVVIAAITSCTNTSNPEVMLGAALLARNAVEKGLTSKPWVKTSMAPGSQVVTDYYDKAGLWPYLEKLGFYLVGYGCTTCIGNSGPLPEEISKAINDNDLTVTAVLSGNRNFEGRINPDVKMNYLASPPLVVAYALAGIAWTSTSTPTRSGTDKRRQ